MAQISAAALEVKVLTEGARTVFGREVVPVPDGSREEAALASVVVFSQDHV
jgi:hypothetical protein